MISKIRNIVTKSNKYLLNIYIVLGNMVGDFTYILFIL